MQGTAQSFSAFFASAHVSPVAAHVSRVTKRGGVVLSGKTYEHSVPDIETQAHTHTHSLYIYIHTHTGKTCEHRVPDDEAQAWLDALIFTVKEAKAHPSRSIVQGKYGHSAYSMMRAREADQEEGGGRRLY